MARPIHAALAAALVLAPLAAAQPREPAPAPPAEGAGEIRGRKARRAAIARMLGVLRALDRQAIEAAGLAFDKAEAPEVREVARAILEDHRRLDRAIDRLAEEGLAPEAPDDPTWWALQRAHEQQLQDWRQLEGAAFDAAFVASQPFRHRFGLALIEDGRRHARDLERVLQVLDRAHRSMGDHLEMSLGLLQRRFGAAQEGPPGQGG